MNISEKALLGLKSFNKRIWIDLHMFLKLSFDY